MPVAVEKEVREWSHRSVQKKDNLKENLEDTDFPPGYFEHIFAEDIAADAFPLPFKTIKARMALPEYSCQNCKYMILRSVSGHTVPPLKGSAPMTQGQGEGYG